MEQKNTYKNQGKLSFFSFLSEVPNFIAVTLSALLSQSLLTWLDFVDSFGNMVSDGLVVIQSRKMSCDLRYEYNYGVGKLEAMTAFFCQSIGIGGLLCIILISMMQLVHPEKPSDLLIYVVALKVVNVAVDIVLWQGQHKIKKENPTTVAESEYLSTVGALLFDVATLFSILLVWLLRNYPTSWYISPILSIAISIGLLLAYIKNIRHSMHELTDRTLPEEEQLKLVSTMVKHISEYEDFGSINSRYNGIYVDVDIEVRFAPDTTYEKIEALRSSLQKDLDAEIANCRVSLIITER